MATSEKKIKVNKSNRSIEKSMESCGLNSTGGEDTWRDGTRNGPTAALFRFSV